ncbi:Retrovirus-related Pol polyprotein from transposon opus [Sesamum angolense]|uniref:Retrovirus-related Pol polyprotein from transposon opus n=1 Tax=Sesamum angolense TaxID=2727404 RepID=A0AAE1WWH8_9LAMI|nr:Retrovirus-related Pol polyprotein from transposon opus [Sesamum angolense]
MSDYQEQLTNNYQEAEESKKMRMMERIEPVEEHKEIELVLDEPEKTTRIGSRLSARMETLAIEFLRKNMDVFAWNPSDFKGINLEIIVHRLNVDPQAKLVKQKKRSFGIEHTRIIEEEVEKLLKVGYVVQVQYTKWLSNVVVVPKVAGKWRMCMDFTDMKKACPKDPYPLPWIDFLIDSTAGCSLFSMMDAYQGYHQIFMAEEDRDKTSFITENGIYCYNVMSFGIKNAGATYQKFVNKIFKDLVGKTMEVYVDDMLMKSKEEEEEH